jgi:hypothetical protein
MVSNAVSALELGDNLQAFASLLTRLTYRNLNEAEPSQRAKLLFCDHPTYNERMKPAHNSVSHSDVKFT